VAAHGDVRMPMSCTENESGVENLTFAHVSQPCSNALYSMAEQRAWPRSIADLLPYGLVETVRGVLQWFTLGIAAEDLRNLYNTLLLIVSRSGPLTHPCLLAPPNLFSVRLSRQARQ
jgi:hypothetical protein